MSKCCTLGVVYGWMLTSLLPHVACRSAASIPRYGDVVPDVGTSRRTSLPEFPPLDPEAEIIGPITDPRPIIDGNFPFIANDQFGSFFVDDKPLLPPDYVRELIEQGLDPNGGNPPARTRDFVFQPGPAPLELPSYSVPRRWSAETHRGTGDSTFPPPRTSQVTDDAPRVLHHRVETEYADGVDDMGTSLRDSGSDSADSSRPRLNSERRRLSVYESLQVRDGRRRQLPQAADQHIPRRSDQEASTSTGASTSGTRVLRITKVRRLLDGRTVRYTKVIRQSRSGRRGSSLPATRADVPEDVDC